MESAINDPHPDATEDDAADFFAPPEPSSGSEPSPEGAGDPEGGFDSPEPVSAPETSQEDVDRAAAPPKKGGQLTREYIVFQKVPLTERTLRHLLKQIEEGTPTIRVALFELDRATTRSDKQAIAAVYAGHQQELGARCDLVSVTSRALKERHVKPEEVPAEKRISIT